MVSIFSCWETVEEGEGWVLVAFFPSWVEAGTGGITAPGSVEPDNGGAPGLLEGGWSSPDPEDPVGPTTDLERGALRPRFLLRLVFRVVGPTDVSSDVFGTLRF